jgi:hypothetical protein
LSVNALRYVELWGIACGAVHVFGIALGN